MNKTFNSILVLLVMLLASIYPVNAQDADTTLSTKKSLLKLSLKDLMMVDVITASRKAQKFNEAPANVIVITSTMIERRGYQTLTEVFEDLPGFDFTIKQPAGEFPTHNIFRGITDVGQTKLLLMVDGIIQNDISNGWMNNVGYDLPMSDIERIELISGPGSALYGANAYAGLVHVITKNPFDDSVNNYLLDAKLSYGSNNIVSPEIFAGYKFDNGLSLQLAGRLFTSNGDGGINRPDPGNYFTNNYEPESVLTTEYGNINNEVNEEGKTKYIPDGFKTDINDLSLRGKITKDGFTLGYNFWKKKEGLGSEVVGYEYFTNTAGLDYLVNHSGWLLYSNYDFNLSEKVLSKTLFYYRNTKALPQTGFTYTYKYQSVDNGVDLPVADKKKGYSEEGSELRLEQQFNIDFSIDHFLIFGFMFEKRNEQYFGISLGPEQNENSTIVNSTYTSEKKTVQPVYFINKSALFIQDELRLYKNYHLTTGLRFDYSTNYKSIINPRVAFVGSPVKEITFKLLYGHAFKAPTLFELQDEWRGNPELEPQKIQTAEVELYYFLLENLSIKANYFYSNLNNLIVVAENPDVSKVPIGPNGEHQEYYQNIGSTNISGFTLSLDHIIFDNLAYTINYTNLIGPGGRDIDNVAQHKINFAVNYSLWNKLNINLRGNFIGKVKAPNTNRYFYPKTNASITEVGYDYVVADNPDGYADNVFLLNLTLRSMNLFGDNLTLEPELIIRNVFDTDYYTVGRQSGSGVRPVNAVQPSIQNPGGFIPSYHPQPGRKFIFRLVYKL